MQNSNAMCDNLITEFAENYMQKLFFFCLKKTGNNNEAEELTQDVAVNVLDALNKGTIPVSFSAWVWQIARNRYAVWAEKKHRKNESVTGSDIGDYEIADERDSVLEELLRSEQMGLLRRELAFIKSEYRNLLVAYYIEDRSIREIADNLALSVSAVQQRLHRARIQLKDGMDMARTFGKRSYNPETVSFAASGPQPTGLPWRAVERSIPKNILLQASNNPSTLEELSVELGIALPYMEEEVGMLHEATLLEKCGDKFVTNFFIMDKESQLMIYNIMRSGAKERSRMIQEFMEDSMSDIRAMGIAGEHMEDNVIRWFLVPKLVDFLIQETKDGTDRFEPPVRANGEEWGFVGYEDVELPEVILMGHNGRSSGKNNFWSYKYGDYSMFEQCGEPERELVAFLAECIRENRKAESFSMLEKNMWEKIEGRYAHLEGEGAVIPDILVFRGEQERELRRMFQAHKHYDALLHNCTDEYERIEAVLKQYNHKVLHEAMGYNIKMELYGMRMMAVHDLVENGCLKLPENPEKSNLGMHMILN